MEVKSFLTFGPGCCLSAAQAYCLSSSLQKMNLKNGPMVLDYTVKATKMVYQIQKISFL